MPLQTQSNLFLIPEFAAVDTIASLQGSNGEVIAVSKVHGLCTKIHDSLCSAVSEQVVVWLIVLPL